MQKEIIEIDKMKLHLTAEQSKCRRRTDEMGHIVFLDWWGWSNECAWREPLDCKSFFVICWLLICSWHLYFRNNMPSGCLIRLFPLHIEQWCVTQFQLNCEWTNVIVFGTMHVAYFGLPNFIFGCMSYSVNEWVSKIEWSCCISACYFLVFGKFMSVTSISSVLLVRLMFPWWDWCWCDHQPCLRS